MLSQEGIPDWWCRCEVLIDGEHRGYKIDLSSYMENPTVSLWSAEVLSGLTDRVEEVDDVGGRFVVVVRFNPTEKPGRLGYVLTRGSGRLEPRYSADDESGTLTIRSLVVPSGATR